MTRDPEPAPEPAPEYTIALTRDELIVLDHWLHETDQRPDFEELLPGRAERSAFWSVLAQTERQNPVVFAADYDTALDEARSRITAGDDTDTDDDGDQEE